MEIPQVFFLRAREGRDTALDLWELYIRTPQYVKDLAEVEYYKHEEMNRQRQSEDYGEFYTELHMGRFGDKTHVITVHLNEFVLIAAVFRNKMLEYSAQGHNLVIANYGPNSVWFIPSWWKWGIREMDLYIRTVSILEMRLKRGISTKMLTASGVPLEKAIGYTDSIKGILEDGLAWQCECGMVNSASANFCSNCGSPNPTRTLPKTS